MRIIANQANSGACTATREAREILRASSRAVPGLR